MRPYLLSMLGFISVPLTDGLCLLFRYHVVLPFHVIPEGLVRARLRGLTAMGRKR